MFREQITRRDFLRVATTSTVAAGLAPAVALGAAGKLKRFQYAQIHMAMKVRLLLYAPDRQAARQAATAAFRHTAELENVMSSHRPTSELRHLCAKAGGPPVPASEELFVVLRQAQKLAQQSSGAFDATVGSYVALWREARETGRLPTTQELRQAGLLVGWQKMRLDPKMQTVELATSGMQLNLGGLAKGYILDRALATLRKCGATRALIEAGGDIVTGAAPPGRSGWKVLVPGAGPGGAARKVSLADAAISTSGGTQQFVEIGGEHYSHVIDPRTGLGLTDRILTTVIAPNGLAADGLATTAGILGREAGPAFIRSHPQAKLYLHRAKDAPARLP